MSSIDEAAALLELSLRTRRDLLGARHTGVSREALDRLAKMPAPQTSGSQDVKSGPPRVARLAAISEAVKACRICAHLASFRTQTVFGTGNPEADLMFVGEAPGADEDRLGEPFVGRAGELLTRIIGAMGLSRNDVYIANVLKCRPDIPKGSPGNRPPTPQEMQNCLPYLREQIAVIQPRILVALGKTAMQGLVGTDESMGAMRGRWYSFGDIPLLPTYHPSYLLRNDSNAEKRKVWEDMMLVMEKLGMPVSEKQRNFFLSAK
ncbi:MAG: uracil-DNA glycosylase [Chthoniobacterales bacterium]|nr:uracil-DNA glycosylase [Chthoniobacterales bacterium]